MLHASIRAVGDIAGCPDQIHLALKDALTPEGTLVMYASCPQYYDEVGCGNLTLEQEREVLEKLPAFNPFTDRSQRDNGALVEFFRTFPDSKVNAHVARFVVWGRHADHLFARIVDAYLAQTSNTGSRIGNAESHLLDAGGLLQRALREMTAIGQA